MSSIILIILQYTVWITKIDYNNTCLVLHSNRLLSFTIVVYSANFFADSRLKNASNLLIVKINFVIILIFANFLFRE